uniref:Zinc finger CCCH-type containing 18 n=1 Tax=Haplochromis burtoni TaxID=8153 RepID=A0A3Q2VPA9_HAPBU
MDTPESPTQSPQSPEEEEKGLSDSELLESPNEEEDRVISDSEILNEEGDIEVLESHGKHVELEEEEDEVVPDFVSEPEDEEPFGEMGELGQDDESIVLMEGNEDSPQVAEERERKEDEERVVSTPLSPDSEPEHVKSLSAGKDGEDWKEGYDDYIKAASAECEVAEVDDQEEDYKNKDEEDGRIRDEETRRAAALREVKDDSVSVSRELDEHELDYDEEVPEEPGIPTHEEEDEEDTKVEGDEDEEESEDKSSKKEKKSILPPSPKHSESRRTDGSKGPERIRQESFRDKKKDEDDGEIDEGEIDQDDDLEEGEVKDPSDRKIRPRPICRFFIKQVLKKATIRKEQEPDFEEKRFNVTIGEDEREFDKENDFFRERSYRVIREMDFRDPIYRDPYADPYYDYEMEALWRGGQYENFRVQYTEAPLPYHYSRPIEPPSKKEVVPIMRRPDEWKDPWRRSKSPRRRPAPGSPPRGRRHHRPSGSSISVSNSSSSSRSSSYTGSGSSRSRSRSSSFSSYSSHSSQRSSFSGSHSSQSFSTSPSPSPAALRNAKNKADLQPVVAKIPLKQDAMPPPRRDRPPMKKASSPSMPSGLQSRPSKPLPDGGKPPNNPRDAGGAGAGGAVKPLPPREPGKPVNLREGRRKERQQHPPRRTMSGSISESGSSYTGSSSRSRSSSNTLSRSHSGSRKSSLSVSSVSSVSSASSSSSSVRSADSDDMYADLASPVSSASSRSPTPNHPRKERGPPRDRSPHGRDKRPSKKDEPFREDRRKIDQSGPPPREGNPLPRAGPGNRGGHPVHPPPGTMGPPGNYGSSSSHRDIKLTLLNKQQQGDKGNRKRYLPGDKDRPGSPLNKRMAMSPDKRDKRIPGRLPLSPRIDRPRGRPMPPQGDKRPLSPPPKSSGKSPAAPSAKLVTPSPASGAGSGSSKPSNTLSRREELLKQLKAVEDAIARKRAKIPAK